MCLAGGMLVIWSGLNSAAFSSIKTLDLGSAHKLLSACLSQGCASRVLALFVRGCPADTRLCHHPSPPAPVPLTALICGVRACPTRSLCPVPRVSTSPANLTLPCAGILPVVVEAARRPCVQSLAAPHLCRVTDPAIWISFHAHDPQVLHPFLPSAVPKLLARSCGGISLLSSEGISHLYRNHRGQHGQERAKLFGRRQAHRPQGAQCPCPC